jgi:hypothetical protein
MNIPVFDADPTKQGIQTDGDVHLVGRLVDTYLQSLQTIIATNSPESDPASELSKAVGSIRLEVGGTLMRLAYWLPQLISSSVVFNQYNNIHHSIYLLPST